MSIAVERLPFEGETVRRPSLDHPFKGRVALLFYIALALGLAFIA